MMLLVLRVELTGKTTERGLGILQRQESVIVFRQMEDGSYSEIFKTADVQEIYEFVDTGLVPNQTYAYRFGMYDLELHGQSVKIIL